MVFVALLLPPASFSAAPLDQKSPQDLEFEEVSEYIDGLEAQMQNIAKHAQTLVARGHGLSHFYTINVPVHFLLLTEITKSVDGFGTVFSDLGEVRVLCSSTQNCGLTSKSQRQSEAGSLGQGLSKIGQTASDLSENVYKAQASL